MKRRIINQNDDFMLAVTERRREMGMTHGDVDHVVGWQDGYASKVEGGDRVWGKRPFNMTQNAVDLLEALGLAVVIMPADQAAQIAEESTVRKIEQKPRHGRVARKSVRQSWKIKRRM